MSEVRLTTSVRRLRNGKEVTMKMECSTGDAYQEYRGEDSGGKGIASPDWMVEANRPVIWAEIYANLQRVIYTDDVWTYNVTLLKFGSDGLSTNSGLVGTFKRFTYNGVPALKIMKNLASKENQDNDVIMLDCAIKVGGLDDRSQSSITVQIGRASADVYKGSIMPVDGKGFTIRETNGSVQALAKLFFGGAVVANGDYTVDWKKQNNGVLVPLTNDAGAAVADTATHTIVLTAGMVNSAMNLYAIYKDKSGKELTTDIQGVVDASDPMYIDKGAVPANETIIEDSDTVVYTPRVLNSDGAVMKEFNGKFKFYLTKEDGTKITGDYDHSKTATSSQTITANDVDKADPGALQIEIVADTAY